MAVVQVSVVPLGTESTSLSDYVAGCVKILREESSLKHTLTPMGTIIEGDLDKIMAIIRRMHEEPFLAGACRVYTNIRIDDRRDKDSSMSEKLASVEQKLKSGGK